MKYKLLIEFGRAGWSCHSHNKKFDLVLVKLQGQGNSIDDVLDQFDHEGFKRECLKKTIFVTFGVQRIIESINKQLLKEIILNDQLNYKDETDHDGAADYFVRASWTVVKEDNIDLSGQLLSTWWRFGEANHGHDHLIINNEDYWYRMFGNFYFNTGKR